MQENNSILKKGELLISWYRTFASKNKKLLFIFRAIFSVFFIVLAVKKINISNFPDLFGRINFIFAFSSLALTFIVSLLFVARIYFLFKGKEKMSFVEQYFINRVGNFFNFFIFGNLGQEISRVKYYQTSKKETIFISFIDRFLGALSLIVVLLFSSKSLSAAIGFNRYLVLFLIILAICLLIFLISFFSKKTNIRFSQVAISFFISMFYSLGLIIISFLSFKAVGVSNVFFDLFWIIPSLSVLLMLPLSINGIGLREFFLISVLKISPELVIAYALLGYIIFIILALPGVGYFLFKTKEQK